MESNNSLLIRNTLMLYFRTFVVMLVSLFTVRVIFSNLGASDYGIQNVVSGFVTMFSFISGSLSVSFSRFFSIEIGRKNIECLKRFFSNSMIIMAFLSAILFVVIEIIGVAFLNYRMNIPPNRLIAANWVLQFSILTLCIQLFTITYDAMIVSYEKMSIYAYISIMDVFLKLIIAFSIQYFEGDKLIIYSILLLVQNAVVLLVYKSYCNRKIENFAINWKIDKKIVKDLLGLTGWDMFGSSSIMLKNYGADIILNLFFGTIINASRSIAMQINVAITRFSGGFLTALRPQILKTYASGDFNRLFMLVDNGTRFSSYLLLLLSIPVILESNYIIKLWLGNVPDHCSAFVILILILSLSEGTLVYSHNTALIALGRVKKCQIITGFVQLLNLPISYLILLFYPYPEMTLIVAIVIAHICCFVRVFILNEYVGYSIGGFIKGTYLLIILVAVLSIIPPLILHCFIEESFIRLIMVGFVSILTSSFFILYIVCNNKERSYIFSRIKIVVVKFRS